MVILLIAQPEEHYKCLFNIASLSTSPLRAHSVNHPGEDNLPPVTLPKFGSSHRTCCGTVHDSVLIPPSRRKISFVITNVRSRLAALATLFLWRHASTLQHHYETCASIAAALENLLPQIHFQTDMHSMADLWVRAVVNGLRFSGMLLRGWGEMRRCLWEQRKKTATVLVKLHQFYYMTTVCCPERLHAICFFPVNIIIISSSITFRCNCTL